MGRGVGRFLRLLGLLLLLSSEVLPILYILLMEEVKMTYLNSMLHMRKVLTPLNKKERCLSPGELFNLFR